MDKAQLDSLNAQVDQFAVPDYFLATMAHMSDELLRVLIALANFAHTFPHFSNYKEKVTVTVLQEITGLNKTAVIRGIDEGIKWELIEVEKCEPIELTEDETDKICFRLGKVPRTPPPSPSSLVGWLNVPNDFGTPGLVYVLHNGQGSYKIGKTTNLNQRLKAYNTHSPHESEVIVAFKVSNITACEADLHKRFAHRHERGEWFRLADEDVQWLLGWNEYLTSECQNRKQNPIPESED